MLEGMHEFYGVAIYKDEVEAKVGRSLTTEEWEDFISAVGTEIDKADSEVLDRMINELKNSVSN